ncbi:MAG TPA: hypothetical protein VLV83_20835 [Acidobacteriota bacterium]|nr:hypothetical protein [Acidobacteriota bacterium]
MQSVKVLIATNVGLGTDLRAVLEPLSGPRLVGEIDPGSNLEILLQVEEREPNLLVLEFDGDRQPGICSHLLDQFPELTLLLLTEDGSDTRLLRRPVVGVDLNGNLENQLCTAIWQVERYLGMDDESHDLPS